MAFLPTRCIMPHVVVLTMTLASFGLVEGKAPLRKMRGGCFAHGTLVTMVDGSKKQIESVDIGDVVRSWNESASAATAATVVGITRVWRRQLLDIVMPHGAGRLTSTPDHPFWSHARRMLVSADPDVTLSLYELGVPVGRFNATELLEDEYGQPVEARARLRGRDGDPSGRRTEVRFLHGSQEQEVITLCLDRHHWFFAGGVRVHNKGGCFIPTTPVTMGDGSQQPIHAVRRGDTVLSWNEAVGSAEHATVLGITHALSDRLMDITLGGGRGSITSTLDHPFWSRARKVLVSADPEATRGDYGIDRPVAAINATEVLEDEQGQPVEGRLRYGRSSFLQRYGRRLSFPRKVLTLCLDRHHWFFASGVRVHNKGGCFAPETPVTMGDGSRRPIGSLQGGEMVRSWDDELGAPTVAKVLAVRRERSRELLDVHLLEAGARIVSTTDHPYWSFAKRSLVSADPRGTLSRYGLGAELALLNGTDFLEDELGRPVEANAVPHPVQTVTGSMLSLRFGQEVVTLELCRHHWFYVHGVRVHNKGGESSVSFCCCNDGLMWDGGTCVPCAGNTSVPNSSCNDNTYIPWSALWLACGSNQHHCYEPSWCCCDAETQWASGSCEQCQEGGNCSSNLAIEDSMNWWSSCPMALSSSHSCYAPMEHSGAYNKYCCCLPYRSWDPSTSVCEKTSLPLDPNVIPGSEAWWSCSTNDGQYSCAPYGSEPPPANWWTLGVFASCCCMICVCFAIGGTTETQKEANYRSRAQKCKRNRHSAVQVTCQQMASRDSDYRLSWICDSCGAKYSAGQNEPFFRCEPCQIDFCRTCHLADHHQGSLVRQASNRFHSQQSSSSLLDEDDQE